MEGDRLCEAIIKQVKERQEKDTYQRWVECRAKCWRKRRAELRNKKGVKVERT